MRLRYYDALALTAAIWFLGQFLRYAFPPLFGPLQGAYGVSNTLIGIAYGSLMIAYAGMQFPSGALSDRIGPVRVITGGVVVAALGALSILVPGSLGLLVVGMVLIGLGTGAHKTVSVPMLSTIYRRRPGRALGIFDTVGNFGGVVAPAAVVVMLHTPGWRYVFVAGGLLGIALALSFRLRVPRRLPDGSDSPANSGRGSADADGSGDGGSAADDDFGSTSRSAYRTLFTDRALATVVLATVLSSFAFNGAVAFLPLYLTESAGLSAAFAGLVYSGFFAVSVVQLGTGEIGDRVGMLPVLAGALSLSTLGLVGVLVLGTPFVLAAAVLLFGVGVHGHRPVRGAYFAALLPDEIRGGALGVIRTALIGAGAVAPIVIGFLIDALGFREAFAVIAGTMAIASVLMAVLLVGGRLRRAVSV